MVRTGLFAGIHLDVEPYLSDGWTTDLQATLRRHTWRCWTRCVPASTLPLEADVPFWFGEYTVGAEEPGRRGAQAGQRGHGDELPGHRTGPNSMLAISQDWLARGAAAGKRVRLGAETSPLPDCSHCTFAEEGATRLRQELAKVDAATRKTAAFGGIAVHRYGTWRALKPVTVSGSAQRERVRGPCRPYGRTQRVGRARFPPARRTGREPHGRNQTASSRCDSSGPG